jgi:hypothetical protein
MLLRTVARIPSAAIPKLTKGSIGSTILKARKVQYLVAVVLQVKDIGKSSGVS